MRKVLYIHGVSVYGGSTRSLLEMAKSVSNFQVEPVVICPDGESAQILEENGIEVIRVFGVASFDHTQIGYYRSWRWLILLRTFMNLLPTVLSIRRVLNKYKWDIVHINDSTLLIPAMLTKSYPLPVIWHFRTVMNNNGLRWAFIRKRINSCASQVIAIDDRVASSLKGIENINVIHNCISVPDLNEIESERSGKPFGFNKDKVIFAMLGILIPYKGIYEFLDAAKSCLEKCNNVGFVFVGGNARPDEYYQTFTGKLMSKLGFSKDHKCVIQNIISRYNLDEDIKVIDFTTDTNSIYKDIDVLCFPSHLDAIGRPVFEAAMYGKPTIATLSDKGNDFPVHDIEGMIITPGSVEELTLAMTKLANDADYRVKLGANAKSRAVAEYTCSSTSVKLLNIYNKLLQV